MKKLEPGMLCRVVNCRSADNKGKLVALVGFVGTPPRQDGMSPFWVDEGSWWELDTPLLVESSSRWASKHLPYAPASNLQPINPDHQPADEEWQADFKRLLCGDRQPLNTGVRDYE